MLRGIPAVRCRFALINDRTLLKNETAKVRVGDTNVVLQVGHRNELGHYSDPRSRNQHALFSIQLANELNNRCF